MGKLPKAIIRKYGISKKAWSVYRGSKTKKRKSSRRKTSVKRRTHTMAKRRKGSYRRKATNMLGKLNKPVVGAAAMIAYDRFVSPMIPIQGMSKDIAELGIGMMLSGQRMPILKSMGNTMLVLNTYQIVSRLTAGIGGAGTPAATGFR